MVPRARARSRQTSSRTRSTIRASIASEIEKLAELGDSGVLSDEQFEAAKSKLLE